MKALVALLALFLLSAAPAAAAPTRDCGTISGSVALYELRATGVGCPAARTVARAWRSTLLAGRCANGRFRCRVRGYTCRARPPARVHYPVTCVNGARRVAWTIHAD